MSDKVISIGSANSGLTQLFDKSAKTKSATKIEAPKEDEQCCLLHVPLQNKSYYVPINLFGVTPPTQQMPVVVFIAEVAYSEVRVPDDFEMDTISGVRVKVNIPISIQRHNTLQIAATGIVTEIVSTPSWWSKRDEGGF